MKFIERNPIIMILVGIMGISLSAIFVKYSTAPSAVTAAYRLLWTVLLMSPVVLGRKETRQEIRSITPKLAILSALSGILLAIHFSTWFESLHHTSVAGSTVIVCTEVIWVALGYCLFMKGRMNRMEILSVGITLIGSVIIALADGSSGGDNQLYGDFLALIAAVAVGGYTLLGRMVRAQNVSTSVYTYIVYVCCAACLVVLVLCQGNALWGYGWSGVIVGLLLSIFSTILGHSIFSWCLKYFSPTFVSASKLCEPVVAGIFAGFLFLEIPGPFLVLGGVIVLAGVVMYSLVESKK